MGSVKGGEMDQRTPLAFLLSCFLAFLLSCFLAFLLSCFLAFLLSCFLSCFLSGVFLRSPRRFFISTPLSSLLCLVDRSVGRFCPEAWSARSRSDRDIR